MTARESTQAALCVVCGEPEGKPHKMSCRPENREAAGRHGAQPVQLLSPEIVAAIRTIDAYGSVRGDGEDIQTAATLLAETIKALQAQVASLTADNAVLLDAARALRDPNDANSPGVLAALSVLEKPHPGAALLEQQRKEVEAKDGRIKALKAARDEDMSASYRSGLSRMRKDAESAVVLVGVAPDTIASAFRMIDRKDTTP